VDEAEEALARFLDRMILEGASSVLIIHGHGTGALRQTVRLILKGTPQIRHFRPGGQGEGGDGVTVAFLG
jgi:DNA mismatch repair protein MutS2